MAGQVTSSPIREVKNAGNQAQAFAKLVEHPSWQELVKEFESRRQTAFSKLGREMLTGVENADPVDQRVIDYRRGFLRGAEAVLRTPENAIRLFEQELEKEKAS